MGDAVTDIGAVTVVERVEAAQARDTREAGLRLGSRLRAGDLVILSGELGAGKTTFTQGLAESLGVRGPITSPTFVIARVHPSLSGGTPLVHVDAYRLGSLAELDDLDLDASVEDSVTVVEWGEGKAEVLSGERLEVRIERTAALDAAAAQGADDVRVVEVRAYGAGLAERFG
nr:tRNA (adenosine(37)-N6)-threonylcarbamoyltransferase complex ATPase subunit type 1 TsaE [Actinocrinis puniceicyclus]